MNTIIALTLFPGGLCLLASGLAFEWLERKLLARMQNRVGPRWFQPFADTLKLLLKAELMPDGVDARLFAALPVVALAGALTAGLYVPLLGLAPSFSFTGDLIVSVYLLSLLTLCMAVAGAHTFDRFSLLGATRTLTQYFSYEAPFLLALLGPAVVARSWQVSEVAAYAGQHWLALTQPVGLALALLGLMGKLEIPPFDAPEAQTEIVAGALTEYSGRGLALFKIGKSIELMVGITLVSAFYLGGLHGILPFLAKTLAVLFLMTVLQTLLTRLRIDQTVGMWWRFGSIFVLAQILITILLRGGLL